MPLPEGIKPKHVVYVVWTMMGAAYVSDDRDEAKAYKRQAEANGHTATVRKYTAGKERVPHGSESL